MLNQNRRTFLRHAALGGMGTAVLPQAPLILTPRRTRPHTAQGTLVFRPYYVQRGQGPHFQGDYAYASDTKWDAFHSNITATPEQGIVLSDTQGEARFGVNVRWNVEGFGFTFLTADNGGDFYALPPEGRTQTLNLNAELAKSRVARNRNRRAKHEASGWRPSREVQGLLAISENYWEDAQNAGDEVRRGALAQEALRHALWAAERMELEASRHAILRNGHRPDFFFGCDARGYYQMENLSDFMPLFTDVFNFATITYVPTHDGVINDFEPVEGVHDFEYRDSLFNRLRAHEITVEGRLLFWFHTWVTPDWMKAKSYDELLKYVERHTREVISHYPEGMYGWEIVNELHDWANEVALTPEQTVELTKLACEVAKDTNPNVHRFVNNCCPFAEYVQMGQWSGQPAIYPQRTPWEFTRDLVDAGVDFTIIGQQMYFPYRDLQDIIVSIERYEPFGKPVQISEIGAPGGPTERSVKLGTVGMPQEPYVWHRPWDEELQADWLEALYTLGYSKPWIEAVNWFDFVDPHSYIDNGGLLRSPAGEPKAAYHRLKNLRTVWDRLPNGFTPAKSE